MTRLGLDMTTYSINVQSLALPIMKIGKSMQNIENGVVGGSYGHSRSLEIAPFDRTHRVPIVFRCNYAPPYLAPFL